MPDKKNDFIKQKIVKKSTPANRIFIHGLKLVISAVIFGIVAVVTAAVSRPYVNRVFGQETSMSSEPVTIPRDNPETMATEAASEGSDEETKETEPVEELVSSAIETYSFTVDDYNKMVANLAGVADAADADVVTVHSVKEETDWFDNSVEKSGAYSGVVIAKTGKEILILAPEAAAEDADSLKVTWNDGDEVPAVLKRTDSISGLAVVAVALTDMDKKKAEACEPLVLGNSYQIKRGDMLIAVGSPSGMSHSTSYGFVSYVAKNVSVTDGSIRLLYCDLDAGAAQGSWIINTDGELVGWVSDAYTKATDSDTVDNTIVGLSDYKSILERMINAQASAYFGIKGAEVTGSMKDQGMPEGIYVTNSISGGPAYAAGIQSGDIITDIDSESIKTMSGYKTKLETLHAEDTLRVTVMRKGRDGYKELEYQLTVGAR